jgi:MFS superfamily sulfate permease-like transporter
MNHYIQSFLKGDWKSGIAVFLVALPLCLGIALASGAPLLAGLVAGIVGGIIVSLLSGSELSVSGPAAGLTIIVATAIIDLGSFPGFLVAVILAGVIQIALGLLKLGKIGGFFPSSVIRGMLVAIGIVIILKQIPHAIGDDLDFIGEFEFDQKDGKNTFSEILASFTTLKSGALLISTIG